MPSATGDSRLRPLDPILQSLLFGDQYDRQIDEDLPFMVEVDRAHLVMLVEQRIVAPAHAIPVLGLINELKASNFDCLRAQRAPRGLFAAYESYLIDRLGIESAGTLQTARSRNDLGATVFRLKLRGPVTALLKAMVMLQTTLLRQAWLYRSVTMPIYTHGQAG